MTSQDASLNGWSGLLDLTVTSRPLNWAFREVALVDKLFPTRIFNLVQ